MSILPEREMLKLILVVAFDRDEDGYLAGSVRPGRAAERECAIRTELGLALAHAGVIAWSREANPALGEYSEAVTLFQAGDVPDME